VTIRVQDRGADRLLQMAAEARGPWTVRVGVIGGQASEQHAVDELTVADVATFHEFGLGVPRRSFIADYVDENVPAIRKRLRSIAQAVSTRGLPVRPGLEQFGALTQGEIQQRMASGTDWPPLSEEYAATHHHGDRTARLIMTGQLRSSVTWDIVVGARLAE